MPRLREKPAHRATTANFQAVYPFQSEAGFGARGPYIGASRLGAAFCYDPWELYNAGHLTNPNMLVMGEIGSGKSSLVKTLIWRTLLLKDRRAVIVDPKGEYGPLTRALGAEPVKLEPHGRVRLNPLHPGAGVQAQQSMLQAAIAAVLDRPLQPIEEAAALEALRVVSQDRDEPTIAEVSALMLEPTAPMAKALSMKQAELKSGSRDAALALRALCEGPLAGMFDGRSTGEIDFDKKVLTLDLSAVYSNAALGIFMGCAFGWLDAAIADHRKKNQRIKYSSLTDEGWRLFSHVGLAERQQDRNKISRSYGIANIVVTHRLSDLQAAGDAGSRVERLVTGFIEDTGTHVIYKQAGGATALLEQHYNISNTERDMIRTAGRGVALWVVGDRRFIVHHQLSQLEAELVDTDQQMRNTDELE